MSRQIRPRRARRPLLRKSPPVEIIVTASKQGVALDRFGGTSIAPIWKARISAASASGRSDAGARAGCRCSASTNLGRAATRSSFAASPTAASTTQRVDRRPVSRRPSAAPSTRPTPISNCTISRVELLEGPQGTLYGSGSLGGIIAADTQPAGSLGSGRRLLRRAPSLPATAIREATFRRWPNIPLVSDRLALRAVGYASTEGGYIRRHRPRAERRQSDSIYGGRATLLWEAGNDWRFELGGLLQNVVGRDGQICDARPAALEPAGPISPSRSTNDYQLGQATIRKRWAGRRARAPRPGLVRHSLGRRVRTRPDSRERPPATLSSEDIDITLISNETAPVAAQ
jgi:hypothetical protein